jgi:hypothetical protein
MRHQSDAPVQVAVFVRSLHLKRAPGALGRLRQRFLLLPVVCAGREAVHISKKVALRVVGWMHPCWAQCRHVALWT